MHKKKANLKSFGQRDRKRNIKYDIHVSAFIIHAYDP